jgi:hypothetical protein
MPASRHFSVRVFKILVLSQCPFGFNFLQLTGFQGHVVL